MCGTMSMTETAPFTLTDTNIRNYDIADIGIHSESNENNKVPI